MRRRLKTCDGGQVREIRVRDRWYGDEDKETSA
jgi:hypothetical protein